jgi:hypothetical protein
MRNSRCEYDPKERETELRKGVESLQSIQINPVPTRTANFHRPLTVLSLIRKLTLYDTLSLSTFTRATLEDLSLHPVLHSMNASVHAKDIDTICVVLNELANARIGTSFLSLTLLFRLHARLLCPSFAE